MLDADSLPMPRQPLRLDHHESVLRQVRERLQAEIAQLERRLANLRSHPGEHAALMINTYERMIARKKHFMATGQLRDS